MISWKKVGGVVALNDQLFLWILDQLCPSPSRCGDETVRVFRARMPTVARAPQTYRRAKR